MILSGKNEENESMKKAKFIPENQVFGQAGGTGSNGKSTRSIWTIEEIKKGL